MSPASPPDDPGARAVVLAAVAGAHGVQGEVRLKLFGEGLERYRTFNDGALTLTSLRGQIARFAEVGDRNAAERLRGTTLSVRRDQLPPLEPGEYYHVDLLGLPCLSSAGDDLGRVVLVEDFGAGDVLEIARPDGRRFMVPIKAVTIEPERLVIDGNYVEA